MKQNNIVSGLCIVITDFNGWAQTKHCLVALRQSVYKDFHVIVVAHGTTDETARALLLEFPEVECIAGDPAMWWTGATNLGIKHALAKGAHLVMLLNNDCYMSPDAIGKLLGHSRYCGENAIVAPVTKDILTGRVLNQGFTTCLLLGFPSIRPPSFHAFESCEINGLKPARLIMGGRGVIIPALVFHRVGFLDEDNLPHYLSDHDFYLRCKEAGVALMHATDAQLLVDNTRTTIAINHANMTMSAFRESLINTRSHRNIKDLSAFFKKHYPIRKLYAVGVALNVTRYTILYLITRTLHALRIWHS